jgi:membrane protein YqaA with SNARE-associated domain
MFRSAFSDSIELSREFFVSLGAPGLFAVAFLEFFLFPVPPDLVLIPLTVARPEFALVYAAITTAGSVSAGVVGYTVGRKGGRPALETRFSDARIDRAEEYVEQHGVATLIFGAFAPIPEGYELLSIAAGVFGLGPRSYLLASVVGRGSRYFLEAMLVLAIGEAARSFTEVEIYSIIGIASLLVISGYLLRRWWLPRRWRAIAE